MCRYLCSNGASEDIRVCRSVRGGVAFGCLTPIHIASSQGRLDILNWFLAVGQREDMWRTTRLMNRTPLHEACMAGCLGAAKWLCEVTGPPPGGALCLQDNAGLTPLLAAARAHQTRLPLSLVERPILGASFN